MDSVLALKGQSAKGFELSPIQNEKKVHPDYVLEIGGQTGFNFDHFSLRDYNLLICRNKTVAIACIISDLLIPWIFKVFWTRPILVRGKFENCPENYIYNKRLNESK